MKLGSLTQGFDVLGVTTMNSCSETSELIQSRDVYPVLRAVDLMMFCMHARCSDL